jgi:hypothetical protein
MASLATAFFNCGRSTCPGNEEDDKRMPAHTSNPANGVVFIVETFPYHHSRDKILFGMRPGFLHWGEAAGFGEFQPRITGMHTDKMGWDSVLFSFSEGKFA